MRRVGLASCRPLPVDSTVNNFHPPHGPLLQRMHFAASVKRGRSFEIRARAGPSTHTGTRVQAAQAERGRCSPGLSLESGPGLVG